MAVPAFLAAGAVGTTANNYASPSSASAALPVGMTSGRTLMVLFAFFDMGATTSGSIGTPAGWTDLGLDSGAVANSQIAKVFGRVFQTGDAAPSVSFTGGTTGTSGATGLAAILAYNDVDVSAFPGTPGSVLVGSGTALNQTATNVNIASIPGFTPTANNSRVVVFGGKSSPTGGNPTGYAVLTGESLTWAERIDAGSTSAGDAWMVIDDAAMPTAAAVAAKTFTATGGTTSKAVGRMFALKPRPDAPAIGISQPTLTFEATAGGSTPPAQNISITNTGDAGTTLNWTATDDAAWLSVTASGTAPSAMAVSVDITGLAVGTYNGTITIAATGAQNTPQAAVASLIIYPASRNNNAEGGTDLATITTGNTGGASGDAFQEVVIGASATAAFAADQEAHGSLAYKLTQPASATAIQLGWHTGSQQRLYGRAYCRLAPIGSASQGLVSIYNGVPDFATNFFLAAIIVGTSGRLSIWRSSTPNSISSVATGTTVLSANAWFRVEWDFAFSTTAATLIVKLFTDPDSRTPIETITASSQVLRFATADRVFFGAGGETALGVANQSVWFDDLNVNITDLPGSAVPQLPFENDAEGRTDGTTITTTNSGGSGREPFHTIDPGGVGATRIFAADQKAHGSLAYKLVQPPSSASQFHLGWNLGNQARLYGRAYCRVSALGSSGQTLMQVHNGAPHSTTNYYVASVAVSPSGRLSLRRGTGPSTAVTVVQSVGLTVAPPDSWFRIEWDFTFSTTAGVLTVHIFTDPDSATPTETITASGLALRFDTVDRILFGTGPEVGSDLGSTLWLDDLNVNTTALPGPVGGGGTVYTDSGSGTIIASGSGTDSRIYTDSGSGAIAAGGSGTDSRIYTDSGSGAIAAGGYGTYALSTLTDDFSTLDTTKWDALGVPPPFVSSGQLHVPRSLDSPHLVAKGRYDVLGAGASVEVVQVNTTIIEAETDFFLWRDQLNWLLMDVYVWGVGDARLEMYSRVASVTEDPQPYVPYDPVQHRWWRIREQGGNAYWDTSPDGATWTNQRTATWPLSTTIVQPELLSSYGSTTASDDAIFDNFNIPGVPSGINYTDSGSGTVTASGSGTESAAYADPGAGTITASGSGVESYARAYTDSGSGTVTASGTGVESYATSDSSSGIATANGTGTESFTHSGSASGTATFNGTGVESAAHSASGTGTATASGSGVESFAHSASATGTATASGTGVESAAYTDARSGTITASGTGVESASRVRDAAASLLGTGSLAVAGKRAREGATSLTGVGTLAVVPRRRRRAATSIVGVGTLAVQPRRGREASVALTGVGTLAAQGRRQRESSALLTGVGTLAVQPRRRRRSSVAVTGVGVLAVAAKRQRETAVVLTGVGVLTAQPRRQREASVVLTGVGTLHATPAITGVEFGSVSLVGTGALTASAKRQRESSVTLTGVAALAVTPRRRRRAATTLAGVGTLGVTPRRYRHAATTLTGIAALQVAARRHRSAAAALTGVGTLYAIPAITGVEIGAVSLVGTATLSVAAKRQRASAVDLLGVSALVVDGEVVAAPPDIGAASLIGTASLSARGKRTRSGRVALVGVGRLAATPRFDQARGWVVTGAITRDDEITTGGPIVIYSTPSTGTVDRPTTIETGSIEWATTSP